MRRKILSKKPSILDSLDDKTRDLVDGVINIEKDYMHLKNLDKDKATEKRISEEIVKLIKKRVSK